MADSDSGTHVTDISESLQDDFESRKEGTIMKNQSIITTRCSWSTHIHSWTQLLSLSDRFPKNEVHKIYIQ